MNEIIAPIAQAYYLGEMIGINQANIGFCKDLQDRQGGFARTDQVFPQEIAPIGIDAVMR